MSSNPYRLELLFKKYIAGACTQQELDEFWSLMAELTKEERLSIGLDEAWRAQQDEVGLNNEQWDKVYSRLRLKIQRQEEEPVVRIFEIKKYVAAASIIAVLFLGYLFYKSSAPTDGYNSNPVLQKVLVPVQTDTRVMTLPDGTEVTLRKSGTLSFDSSSFLNGKTRSVDLTGEAYFDVAHDTGKPFIVHSGNYSIRVLGTAFNVNAAKGKFEVTVARGKVKVEELSSHKTLGTLTQGDFLAMNKLPAEEVALVTKKVDIDSVSKWVRQDLAFKNEDWRTAAKTMYEKYGVDIKIGNDKLEQCRFTADVTDKSLDDCLDILCAITNAQWRKSGTNTIDIIGDGCN
ncbi:MAG TPA: FecR domain-containing protein [Niabella sp.]|nr:FecR domain-containing protein [Niabella sp.]